MKVKELVAQLCLILCNPMDCSPPGSSVYGILQARILEWIAVRFSRGFPNPGIQPRSPALQADSLPFKPPGKALQTSLYLEKYASYPLQLRSPCVLLTPVPPSFFCNLLHQLPLFLSPLKLWAGEGNDNPLQYSCLENSMHRVAWRATDHGVAKSRTRLSD